MAAIEKSREPAPCWDGLHHDIVQIVIDNMSVLLEINRKYDFIISVNLIAILITGLAAMSRIMKEKRIVGLRVFDEPEHGINHIFSCRALPRILTVVCKHHDIFSLIAPKANQEVPNMPGIIDTTSQFVSLSKIIDTNAKGLLAPSTLGIPEALHRGCGLCRLDRGLELMLLAMFDHHRLRAAAAVNSCMNLGLGTRCSLAGIAMVVIVMVVVPLNEEGPRRV